MPNLPTIPSEGKKNDRSFKEECTKLVERDASRTHFSSLPQLLGRKLTLSVFFKVKLSGSRWNLARGYDLSTEGILRLALCSVDHCPPITPLART